MQLSHDQWTRLVMELRPAILGKIMTIVHSNREDAEDLTQDTFCKAYAELGTFRQQCTLSSWIIAIAIILALNHNRATMQKIRTIRQGRFQEQNDTEAGIERHTPEDDAINREISSFLEKPLKSHKKWAQVVRMRYWEGMQVPEMAALLDVPKGTVKSRLSKGLAHLRRRIESSRR